MPRELLHELVPAAVSIGLLINPANPKSDVTRVDDCGLYDTVIAALLRQR